ncbi:hypothetical protein [Komagataeibacter saccharivorans]|uniref:hypothetical protein n=1 Tax=Komagataeibacter saccharivorans TaxID=265959 RepID=UPI0015E159E3|nr:hypothetical protein [Komagataeibacter saccharivorans]
MTDDDDKQLILPPGLLDGGTVSDPSVSLGGQDVVKAAILALRRITSTALKGKGTTLLPPACRLRWPFLTAC